MGRSPSTVTLAASEETDFTVHMRLSTCNQCGTSRGAQLRGNPIFKSGGVSETPDS